MLAAIVIQLRDHQRTLIADHACQRAHAVDGARLIQLQAVPVPGAAGVYAHALGHHHAAAAARHAPVKRQRVFGHLPTLYGVGERGEAHDAIARLTMADAYRRE